MGGSGVEDRGDEEAREVSDEPGASEERRPNERDRWAGLRAERESEEAGRNTSWVSVISGWAVAFSSLLALAGLAGGLGAAISGIEGFQVPGGALVRTGFSLVVFGAFLLGGYVAGRMARRSGVRHGILASLPALLVALVLAPLVALGSNPALVDGLHEALLPTAAQGDRRGPFEGILALMMSGPGLLVLLGFPPLAGALGGARGARSGRRRAVSGARGPARDAAKD